MNAVSEMWSKLENDLRQLQTPDLWLRAMASVADVQNADAVTWTVSADSRNMGNTAKSIHMTSLFNAYCARAWNLSGSPATTGAGNSRTDGEIQVVIWWLNTLERESPHRKALTVSGTWIADPRYDEFRAAHDELLAARDKFLFTSPDEPSQKKSLKAIWSKRLKAVRHERYAKIRSEVSGQVNEDYEPFLNRISFSNRECPYFDDVIQASVDLCQLRKADCEKEESRGLARSGEAMTKEELWEWLRPYWRKAGFDNQTQWARLSRVPPATVSNYMNRKLKRGLTPDNRRKLAEKIGLSPKDLPE